MILNVQYISAVNDWPQNQINFKFFDKNPLAGDRPVLVHLDRSNKSFQTPANVSILDGLLNVRMDVPHGCKNGECLMCTARVVGRESEHHNLYLIPFEKNLHCASTFSEPSEVN